MCWLSVFFSEFIMGMGNATYFEVKSNEMGKL